MGPESKTAKTAAPVCPRQSIEPNGIILEPLDLMQFALLDFGLASGPSLLPSFLFLSFGMGLSTYACPPLYFGNTLLILFHKSQLERNFGSG